MKKTVEYIWLDGSDIMPRLRSKTRVLDEFEAPKDWSFDGGSTSQATLDNSDTILHPVRFYKDPFRRDGNENLLALCEVRSLDGKDHPTNTRALLRDQMILPDAKSAEPLFGFEQEYTLVSNESLSPNPYAYCGVGQENCLHRQFAEEHLEKCIYAGVGIYGINAEVMPGQWEFQTDPLDPLAACDDLWMARYILQRISENYDSFTLTLHPKPVAHDNGAGCHTNFSTLLMRYNIKHIYTAMEKLEWTHARHMKEYGESNDLRMTGQNETSKYDEFSYGESHRGCSIRIPSHVVSAGRGYFEDRRPAANCDPYRVAYNLIHSVCVESSITSPFPV